MATQLPSETPVPGRYPIIEGEHTYASISERICDFVQRRPLKVGWLMVTGFFFCFTMLMLLAITWLLVKGVGIWGINIPVGWGFAITNFVWWIGIGHAGTLISAILWLLHQEWRTSINRFAEAMTLFAVACAGLFPLLHLGRPFYFYFLMPYPNSFGLWPQFRSPLIWDFAAVLTYLLVSLMFWFVGLVPDLATMRDRAKNRWIGKLFAVLAMGWSGTSRQWRDHSAAYVILAGLATPLVISVHSIVSLDFAYGIVPGWHSTIFPPYFVAGAVFSGFAMVLTLTIPLRAVYKLHDIITMQHLENCAKVMLSMGLVVAYGYACEGFTTWYSGNRAEISLMHDRFFGAYAPVIWMLLFCNVLAPQLLWWRKARTNVVTLWIMALIVQIGMWTERFVIVVVSLHHDFMPSQWGMYRPTFWDWALLSGTIGFFFFLFMLFIRLLPMSSISELRKLIHKQQVQKEADAA